MAKLLLLSILFATLAIPAFAARERNPVRGLRKLLAGMFLFSLFYWLVVMFLTPAV
jgi:hypothetical protein